MNTIWKYELGPSESVITTPRDAVILTAAAQGSNICVWVQVDPDNPADEVHGFDVFGTGHPIPNDGMQRRYMGTAFLGELVLHVYKANH